MSQRKRLAPCDAIRIGFASLGAIVALGLGGCPPTGGNGNGNGNGGGDPNVPQPIFPADYRSSYTLVRECRSSIEHAATIRVWVNPTGAAAYLADQNPLPVGTIVVKEEFAGTSCTNDAELIIWSVMKKEAPGFDPEDGDWRWQEVSAPGRVVTLNDKLTCIRCHERFECRERDYMCTEP